MAISMDYEGIWDWGPSLTHAQVMADLDALEAKCLAMIPEQRARVSALSPEDLAEHVFNPADVIQAVRTDIPPLVIDGVIQEL